MNPTLSFSTALLLLLVLAGARSHPAFPKALRRWQRTVRVRRAAARLGGPIPPLTYRLRPSVLLNRKCRRTARRLRALGFCDLGTYRYAPSVKRGIVLVDAAGEICAEIIGAPNGEQDLRLFRIGVDGSFLEGVSAAGTPASGPTLASNRWVVRPGMRLEALVEELRAAELGVEPVRLDRRSYPAHAAALRRRIAEAELRRQRYSPGFVARLERLAGRRADPASVAFLASL